MMPAVVIAALSIAFPKPDASLPAIDRCYLIGATEPGTADLVIQGRPVEVHPMGGFVTMLDVTGGVNEVVIETGALRTNVAFRVQPRLSVVKFISLETAKPRVYEKLAYAADEPKEPPKGRTPSEVTVVIDAGHGGKDNGAVGPHGLEEKDANLRMAREVRKTLEAKGFKVVMTRDDDRFVELYDRPKVAHAANADAFISIHHNAPPFDRDPRELRYHAVYCWNGIGEVLAKSINVRMGEAFGTSLTNNGVIHANFAVTRNPEIPSCLIEVDFITSPQGEIDCWNRSRRARIAEAIADGFADWCR